MCAWVNKLFNVVLFCKLNKLPVFLFCRCSLAMMEDLGISVVP